MKNPTGDPVQTITFPASRIGTLDVNRIGHGLPRVKALLEIDVTTGLAALRKAKEAGGRDLSFTAWMIWHIAQSLREYPRMHAFLKNKRQLTVFSDIDISILVERDHKGYKVPLVFVLRQAGRKGIDEITDEIRNAQREPADAATAVLSGGFSRALTGLFWSLPGFLRRFLFRQWLGRHSASQRQMGSVIVTSVGMFGDVPGWFIHDSIHPLAFGIGAVTRKPGVVGDRIEPRDILHLTVLMDHDVVDGGYMARFVADLCGRLKEGKPYVFANT